MKRLAILAIFALTCLALPAQTKPKVRAITVFVRITPQNYEAKLSEAFTVARKTKSEFESAGYAVETLRFTTQPLANSHRPA